MVHPDAEFINKRQELFTKAVYEGDLNTIISYYVDDGLEYSDYGIMRLSMSKPVLVEVFNGMFEHCGNWDCKTIAVTRDKHFTVWESESSHTQLKETPMMKYKVGDRSTLPGACLQWWDEKGEKIVKQKDYVVFKDPEPHN